MSGELSTRTGESRRLTMMFCDLVGSTELSGRHEPEAYHELILTYRRLCRDIIESRFEGHIIQPKGDGLLSTFGYPLAHENDAERAVRAGLAIVRELRDLSKDTAARTGESLEVRIAVHHGPVFLDLSDGEISGFTTNVAARLDGAADPGTVVVSEEVRELVQDRFEIEYVGLRPLKGVDFDVPTYRVVGELAMPVRRARSSPLIERDGQINRLRQAWAKAESGVGDRAAGVMVTGSAGVGKTRLVEAIVDEAQEAIVIPLRGSPFHREVGYHPVRKLIEDRCAVSEDATAVERLACLTRDVTELRLDQVGTVPLLAPVLDIDPSAGYDPAATEGRKLEEQVAQAVLDYVVACARGRPSLLVAEDVHWFDQATGELLTSLLRSGPGTMLVLGTSRLQQIGAWETIELRPLTTAGSIALIHALEDGLTEQERRVLAARSGGIPLYVEELVRAGVAATAPAAHVAPVPGSIPEALYEPLVARIYETPEALPVAAAAAAAGQRVDRSLLAATLSVPVEDLESPLRALVDADVLEPVEAGAGRYQFRHELLREVAYELQPPSWRRQVHHRLCDILSGDEPSDWHVLASHYERAERYSEAAAAYAETAERARRRGALEEARAHLTRAVELVGPLPGEAEREVDLRLRRGFMAMSAEGAGSAQAADDFERCLELAAADPKGNAMFSTLISLWAYYLARGELDRAREVSVTLRPGHAGKRRFFRPQNLAGFGMLDWFSGRFADACDTLARATGDLARGGTREDDVAAVWFVPNDPTAAMHTHLALARFMAGDVTGAGESLATAVTVAAPLEFPQGPWSAAYANWLGSWMWIEAGRYDDADRAIAEVRSSGDRHGFDNWALIGLTQATALGGIAALNAGTADAEALSAHAEELGGLVEVWKALEVRVLLPFYLTTTGALLAASGDAVRARERYEESLALAAETGQCFYDAETTRRLAHLDADGEAVAAKLHEALDLARSQAARPFERRIEHDLHSLTTA
jgi:class 3 adenylate cyclase